MPSISKRAVNYPASPIRKLVPYAEAAKRKGIHIYHLNIGQPDIATPPDFFEAVNSFKDQVLAYGKSQGGEILRSSIQAYFANLGFDLGLSNINVTTGASEALNFAFTVCLDDGDEIIVPEPFYANCDAFASTIGGSLVPVTTYIEDNFALPPMEAIEAKITPHTKAILICNPNNPTGVVYPKEVLEKLREIVLKYDLFLIADEVYREFTYDGLKHYSVLELEGLEENVILVDSVSKRYSACGARVGCLISRNSEIMASVLKIAQARLSPPILEELGAAALYRMPDSYYSGITQEFEARKNLLLEELGNIEGLFCPPVNGAFYVTARLPVHDAEAFCLWMLEKFSFEGSTVMLAPASGFYASPGLGKDEVRIAYVLEADKLKQAVKCLAKGLEEYPGRKDIELPVAQVKIS